MTSPRDGDRAPRPAAFVPDRARPCTGAWTALVRALVLAFAALAACAPVPPIHAGAPPAVELDRVRAAIQGTWSAAQSNDTGTITETLAFGPTTAARSETRTQLDGTSATTPGRTAPYQLTAAGAIAWSFAGEDRLQFTAIVAGAAACATLLGHPCRVLGWSGFLAQSPARTVYRREYDRRWRDAHGEQRVRFVSTLRLTRPLAELARIAAAGEAPRPSGSARACHVELTITTSSVIDGGPQRDATRRFAFECDVTASALGAFARLAVRGVRTDPGAASTAWSNYLASGHVLDGYDRGTREAFRYAFEPIMYFDPADPWILYFERPSGWNGASTETAR